MSTIGRTVLTETTGRPMHVSADGRPEWKAAGVTIDWSTVTAVSGSDVTYPDDTVVKIGKKGLRLGQVLLRITATGKFGPYDDLASDGRQTVTAARRLGDAYILDQSVLEDELGSDHPAVIEGGLVWRDRILMHATTHSLANGPTEAEVLTVFPNLMFLDD